MQSLIGERVNGNWFGPKRDDYCAFRSGSSTWPLVSGIMDSPNRL